MTFKLTKIVGFAPDLPATTPGILIACLGIMPTVRGIGSPPIFTVQTTAGGTSGAMDAAATGAAQLAKADGTIKRYVGTSAKLWEYDGAITLTDRSGSAYSASSTQGWSFCSFGDIALASNYGNTIQKASGGAFSDLATAPKAALIFNVGPPSAPFIMVLGYNDGTATPDGWFCSGISDYTTWNSTAAQSVNGRLLEPTGPFVAGVPFRDGILAWKPNAMYRGDYVGSPLVWQWTRIASDIGCCGKNMATVVNDVAYFADKQGIYKYDGSYPQLLPGYVHDYWRNVVAGTFATSINDTCQMRFDPVRHNLWMSFILGSSTYWLFYNVASQIWGASQAAFVDSAGTKKLTGLLAFNPTPYAIFSDFKIYLGAFNSALSGTSSYLVPVLDTWFEGEPEAITQIDRIRPIFITPGGSQYVSFDQSSVLVSPLFNYSPLTTSYQAYLVSTDPSAVRISNGPQGPSVSTALAVNTNPFSYENGFTFDNAVTANFISATMGLTGNWEMSHIGMSVTRSGGTGKQ